MEEWMFSDAYLNSGTPSRKNGVTLDEENRLRHRTILFSELLAKELKLNRVVVSTSCVLFHRFFAFQSFKHHNRLVSSTQYLSTKGISLRCCCAGEVL